MTIKSFTYEDHLRSWKLQRTEFGDFNLLVGLSGVGKTTIINALRAVRAAGLSLHRRGSHRTWCIELSAGPHMYCWRAQTSIIEGVARETADSETPDLEAIRFDSEEITTGDGKVVVSRSPEQFVFEGHKLPKLKETESAISLLEAEESIAPPPQCTSAHSLQSRRARARDSGRACLS